MDNAAHDLIEENAAILMIYMSSDTTVITSVADRFACAAVESGVATDKATAALTILIAAYEAGVDHKPETLKKLESVAVAMADVTPTWPNLNGPDDNIIDITTAIERIVDSAYLSGMTGVTE